MQEQAVKQLLQVLFRAIPPWQYEALEADRGRSRIARVGFRRRLKPRLKKGHHVQQRLAANRPATFELTDQPVGVPDLDRKLLLRKVQLLTQPLEPSPVYWDTVGVRVRGEHTVETPDFYEALS